MGKIHERNNSFSGLHHYLILFFVMVLNVVRKLLPLSENDNQKLKIEVRIKNRNRKM